MKRTRGRLWKTPGPIDCRTNDRAGRVRTQELPNRCDCAGAGLERTFLNVIVWDVGQSAQSQI